MVVWLKHIIKHIKTTLLENQDIDAAAENEQQNVT